MSARVSVGMPVYNGAAHIAAAIDSLRAQTLPGFELIVVDDGSTDETPAIVEEYCRRDERIRRLAQAHAGVSAARNAAIDAARGDYLAWLDADDRAHPERLARQAAALDAGPELIVLGCAYRLLDGDAPGALQSLPESDTAIRWHCLFHSPFAQPGVMLRLEPLRRLGLRYDESIRSGVEDYALWSRLLEHGCGRNLPEPLVDYRRHPGQLSAAAGTVWEAAGAIARANLERLGVRLPPETVDRLRKWYYAFPDHLARGDAPAALALGEVLRRFAALPGLEKGELRRIRGRWALKLLYGARGLTLRERGAMVGRLGAAGLLAAAAYGRTSIIRHNFHPK